MEGSASFFTLTPIGSSSMELSTGLTFGHKCYSYLITKSYRILGDNIQSCHVRIHALR